MKQSPARRPSKLEGEAPIVSQSRSPLPEEAKGAGNMAELDRRRRTLARAAFLRRLETASPEQRVRSLRLSATQLARYAKARAAEAERIEARRQSLIQPLPENNCCTPPAPVRSSLHD